MKIALVQSSLVWGDIEKNLALFDRKLAGIGACDVILLPEMFTSGSMLVKQDKRVADAEKNKTAAGQATDVGMGRKAGCAGYGVYGI